MGHHVLSFLHHRIADLGNRCQAWPEEAFNGIIPCVYLPHPSMTRCGHTYIISIDMIRYNDLHIIDIFFIDLENSAQTIGFANLTVRLGLVRYFRVD